MRYLLKTTRFVLFISLIVGVIGLFLPWEPGGASLSTANAIAVFVVGQLSSGLGKPGALTWLVLYSGLALSMTLVPWITGSLVRHFLCLFAMAFFLGIPVSKLIPSEIVQDSGVVSGPGHWILFTAALLHYSGLVLLLNYSFRHDRKK